MNNFRIFSLLAIPLFKILLYGCILKASLSGNRTVCQLIANLSVNLTEYYKKNQTYFNS